MKISYPSKRVILKCIPFIFIALLSMGATVSNLGFEKNYLGDDAGVAYQFPNTLKDLIFYMWDAHHAPGKMNLTSTVSFIWNLMILLLYKVGLTSFIIDRFLFFMFLFVTGTGMYMTIRSIFRFFTKQTNEKYLIMASLTGSLFYMFNHYTMALMSVPIFPYHLSYMLFPWVFYALMLNLFSKANINNTILFMFFFILLAAGNPSNTISISLFLLIFTLWFKKLITNVKDRIRLFVIPFFFIFTIGTSYIWLPMLQLNSNPYGNVGIAEDFYSSIQLHSTYTSLPNMLRLAGSVTWESFSYFKLYTQYPSFVFLGFLPIILVLIPFFSLQNQKIKFFFLTILIGSIFFAKGLHPPFRELFLFVFTKIPFYGMFRAVYPKFAYYAVFAASVLISFSINTISDHRRNKIVPYVIVILILIYNVPFFLGQIPQPEFLTQIPKKYISAEKNERLDKNYRMLSLPATPNGGGPIFQWQKNYYVGPPTDMYFFDQEVVESYWFINEGYKNLTSKDSWKISHLEKDFDYFIPLLKIINIKYIILHKDTPEYYKFMTSIKPSQIHGVGKAKVLTNQLTQTDKLKRISTNEFFDIYELNSIDTLPKFYVPEVIVKNTDKLGALEQILTTETKEKSFAVVPLSNYNQASDVSSIRLQIDKINPTLYKIYINNPEKKSFFLIFSENFSTEWEAVSGLKNEKLFSLMQHSPFLGNFLVLLDRLKGTLVPIDESRHQSANAYANAWFINATELSSETDIYVSFKPQVPFVVGLIASFMGALVLLVFLVIKKLKKNVFRS